MKKLFITGNWKSNKTIEEADQWVAGFANLYKKKSIKQEIHIILCVPFTLLYFLKQKIQKLSLPISIGAQDISQFGDGAYTGAVSARQLRDIVDWVIVGHTERRRYFGETDEMLQHKVMQAHEHGINVIYCVNDETLPVPPKVSIISYEPNWAIGTGHSDNPVHANRIINVIKKKSGVDVAIYGGSVTPHNVKLFVDQPEISGVLPGGASLDPQKFFDLIIGASS
ncbi:triosephosphate isomerase [Candidatus Gottesmanbacteria bacterium]|nr:triosephosphate isomerase [Candidatus Gottesmanbacteria bacterium]